MKKKQNKNENVKNKKNNNKSVVIGPENKKNKEVGIIEASETRHIDKKDEQNHKTETVNNEDKKDSKKDENKLSRKDIFDIREKRIGFVFKIIYVFAALFIAAFMEFAKEPSKEETSIYFLLAVTVSVSFIMLITMCIYVFHEMKCFKINTLKFEIKNLSPEFMEAEDSYEGIFNNLTCALITGAVIILVSLESNNKYSNEELGNIVSTVFYISTAILLFIWLALIFFKSYSFPVLRKTLRGSAIIIAMIAVTSCLMTVKLQRYKTDITANDTQIEQNDQVTDNAYIDNLE